MQFIIASVAIVAQHKHFTNMQQNLKEKWWKDIMPKGKIQKSWKSNNESNAFCQTNTVCSYFCNPAFVFNHVVDWFSKYVDPIQDQKLHLITAIKQNRFFSNCRQIFIWYNVYFYFWDFWLSFFDSLFFCSHPKMLSLSKTKSFSIPTCLFHSVTNNTPHTNT